jgi:hypothetical protein
MKRLVVCVVVCVGLASCGGDGAGGSIDVDNLGSELAVAACERQFSCCTTAEITERYMGITFEGQPIDSEETCISFSSAVFAGFALASYKDSLAKGRMEYDGEAAANCVAAIEALSCAQYGAEQFPESGCRPYLIPKVANGGGCTQDYECTSHNCVGEDTPLGEPATDGACMAMPTAGEACDENCAGDLICDSDFGSGVDTCRPARADGTQCNLDRECASDYCEEGTRVCAPKPATCNGL